MTNGSASPFWSSDWLDLQRRYWEQWTQMSQQALGLKTPPANPWEQALSHWAQAVAPATPTATRPFFDAMVEQSRSYLQFVDSMTKQLQQSAQGSQSLQDWQSALNHQFEQYQKWFQAWPAQTANPSDPAAGLLALWQAPLTAWQTTMDKLPNPMQLMTQMAGDGPMSTDANAMMQRLLSLRRVGYSREYDEQLQRIGALTMDYQSALQEYAGVFGRLGMESLDRYRQRLLNVSSEDAETLSSARALYNLWVDISEAVFAERAYSDEFVATHGRLINAQMALRKETSDLLDRLLRLSGMPSRTDVRALQDRYHGLRRENRALRAELASLGERLEALEGETKAKRSGPRKGKRTDEGEASTAEPGDSGTSA